jgi:hypothetical protein
MLARLCNFCEKKIPERMEKIFTHKGEKYRIAVLQVRVQNGVRWKEADVCPGCLNKFLLKAKTINKKEE